MADRKNPNWTYDELVLALDLYLRAERKLIDASDDRVIELSQQLSAFHRETNESANLRNPNGVSMKLANFRRFEAANSLQTGKGLSRGGKLEAEVWARFEHDPDSLQGEAARIRSELSERGYANNLGKPALFHGIQAGNLEEAEELFTRGWTEVVFGTEAKTFGPLTRQHVDRVFFQQGSEAIIAYADFITSYSEDVPEKRLPSKVAKGEKWKYYYGFKNLTRLEIPIPLSDLKRYPSAETVKRGQGAFRIVDPLYRTDPGKARRERERTEEQKIRNRTDLTNLQKEALIKSRRGQGRFRANVKLIESGCRVTRLTLSEAPKGAFLHASHIKPWCDCNDKEKLDGNNGLLLSPHIHYLFDEGYLTFAMDGALIISSKLPAAAIEAWNLTSRIISPKFNDRQEAYLRWHRRNVYVA